MALTPPDDAKRYRSFTPFRAISDPIMSSLIVRSLWPNIEIALSVWLAGECIGIMKSLGWFRLTVLFFKKGGDPM